MQPRTRIMRIGRGAAIAGATAVIAALSMSGEALAHAKSSHSGLVYGLNHPYGLAGTLTFSGHGRDQEDAGTTVPLATTEGGCTESASYLKVTDAYSFHGHYSGDLGSNFGP